MTQTHPLSTPVASGKCLRHIRKDLLKLLRSAFEQLHADLFLEAFTREHIRIVILLQEQENVGINR